MMITRKLPVGIQTFERIREENFVYVDKTALMWNLAAKSAPCFLSRPPCFGKSLLLSTFEAYFEGKKELFEGLAVEKLEKEWNVHPVLHLDLNAEKYDRPKALHAILSNYLTRWEDKWGRDERESTPADRFSGVIRRANEKTGRGVVVLVDEYDKPLLQALGNMPLLEDYRNTLKGFYGVLKSADRHLRFVFLTGVTKFAPESVSNDLNQLNDISMWSDYATICGITREELERDFQPEIKALAEANKITPADVLRKMETLYGGCHFHPAGDGVFNPFSVLSVFNKMEFEDYWFHAGTPIFFVELLKKSDFDLRELIDGVQVPSSAFTEYRVKANNPIPLGYQGGYLTIKGYDPEFKEYSLAFPNEEVKYGFMNFVIPFYTTIPDGEKAFHTSKFVQELEKGKVDAFMLRLKAFFADFPYELSTRTERHYQVVFYLVFKLMGQFTEAEVRSAKGRADAVVKTPKYIYVFEFKLNGTAEQALAQIDDRGYLIPYSVDAREIVKVGVEFNAKERNIGRFLIAGEEI